MLRDWDTFSLRVWKQKPTNTLAWAFFFLTLRIIYSLPQSRFLTCFSLLHPILYTIQLHNWYCAVWKADLGVRSTGLLKHREAQGFFTPSICRIVSVIIASLPPSPILRVLFLSRQFYPISALPNSFHYQHRTEKLLWVSLVLYVHLP